MPREEQCLEAGVRYQVVPRVLCLIFWQQRLLLLRGAPDKKRWANRYNGVGGHVERGEDILSAARRETFEETNLDAGNWRLEGVVTIDVEPDVGVVLFVCTAQAASSQVRESREGRLDWFPLDALPIEQMVPDLPHLLQQIHDRAPAAPPFFAHSRYNASGQMEISFSR